MNSYFIFDNVTKFIVVFTWKNLCIQRRLAYENHNMEVANELNRQLMQKRIEGGWTDLEVKEEFEVYAKVLQQPFLEPIGNMNISYDILDEKGMGLGLSLTLRQVSQCWKYRDAGLKHSEALQNHYRHYCNSVYLTIAYPHFY